MKTSLVLAFLLALSTSSVAVQPEPGGPEPGGPEPGEEGGPGLAIRAAKVLTCAWEGRQVFDRGVVLVRDGRIEEVGGPDLSIPAGYEILDVGDRWLMPGMIDLHSHQAGPHFYSENNLNEAVYLTNPGLRASCAVRPGVAAMQRGLAGGVTTVLYIPGSATNIGGQGVLLKTAHGTYEENLVRDPGSLKLAQFGNPEAWTIGVRMTFEHWNTRSELRRGIGYARRWKRFEEEGGERPEFDMELEVFRDLLAGDIAVSTHTQVYQVVLMTITMVAEELGLPVFFDHSTVGGWLAGEKAHEAGIPAICGPRQIDTVFRGFIEAARNRHEGVRGVAAGYQERGHDMVGFNTDSPGIPQQELSVQAAMAVRYGFDDTSLESVRGLTIVPARAAKLDHRLGSLEPGKDADLLVVTGHPADPRSWVERAIVDGRMVYDVERDGRRF